MSKKIYKKNYGNTKRSWSPEVEVSGTHTEGEGTPVFISDSNWRQTIREHGEEEELKSYTTVGNRGGGGVTAWELKSHQEEVMINSMWMYLKKYT